MNLFDSNSPLFVYRDRFDKSDFCTFFFFFFFLLFMLLICYETETN